MKVYLFVFNGHYLPGQFLLIEETPRKAFNQAVKSLKQMGLYEKNTDLTVEDLYEVDTTKKSIEVIDDGDY